MTELLRLYVASRKNVGLDIRVTSFTSRVVQLSINCSPYPSFVKAIGLAIVERAAYDKIFHVDIENAGFECLL